MIVYSEKHKNNNKTRTNEITTNQPINESTNQPNQPNQPNPQIHQSTNQQINESTNQQATGNNNNNSNSNNNNHHHHHNNNNNNNNNISDLPFLTFSFSFLVAVTLNLCKSEVYQLSFFET